MQLPKTMTPKLVRRLNDECEILRNTKPDVCGCFGCVRVGWCSDVWRAVATNGRVNDKIVGNLTSGGLSDG